MCLEEYVDEDNGITDDVYDFMIGRKEYIPRFDSVYVFLMHDFTNIETFTSHTRGSSSFLYILRHIHV